MAESSDAITGKFDFYDILGYLVPGLTFIGLVTLPFGLIRGAWPSTSFTSAVLYLVAAHILGHILQGFLRAWEPVPEMKDNKGEMGAPSSVLLEEDQKTLADVRTKIGVLANEFWGIPAKDGAQVKPWKEVDDFNRRAVFLQARNLLLQAKKESYFEQLQGKYALMGGVTAALLMVSIYFAGWAARLIPSVRIANCDKFAAYFLLAYLILFAIYLVALHVCSDRIRERRKDKKFLWRFRGLLVSALGLGALLGGFVVASWSPAEKHNSVETQKCPSAVCAACGVGKLEGSEEGKPLPPLDVEQKATFMLILALAAFAAGVRCYGAYKAFAVEFATGVWRDFANFKLLNDSLGKSPAGGEKSTP